MVVCRSGVCVEQTFVVFINIERLRTQLSTCERRARQLICSSHRLDQVRRRSWARAEAVWTRSLRTGQNVLVRAGEARPTCNRSSGPLPRPILALLGHYRRRWQSLKGEKRVGSTGPLGGNAALYRNPIRRSEVDVGFSVTHRPTASLGRGPFRHGAARPTDPCRAQRGGQNCLFWANLGRKTRPTDPKICKTRVDRLNFPTGRPTFDRKSPVGTTRPTDPPVAHPGTLKPRSTSNSPFAVLGSGLFWARRVRRRVSA